MHDLPCSEGRTGAKYPSTMVAIFGEPARARRRKSTQFAGVGRIVLIERSSGCFERSMPLRGESRRKYKSTSVRTASSAVTFRYRHATGTGVGTSELEILGEQAALWRCARGAEIWGLFGLSGQVSASGLGLTGPC